MHDLRHIRKYLTCEAAILAHSALVGSSLDYCNSLFIGPLKSNVNKQLSLARIITSSNKFSRITPLLKNLHWLPVKQCSVFKTLIVQVSPHWFSKVFQPLPYSSIMFLYHQAHQTCQKLPEVPQFLSSVHNSKNSIRDAPASQPGEIALDTMSYTRS